MKTIILFLSLLFASYACASNGSPVRTVDYVDIPSYLGEWYEIARFPNSFQRDCLATKATYSKRSTSKINVKNQCKTKTGKLKTARAIGHIANKRTNAKLKVSFVPFFNRFGWFAGDYWILDLASDYSFVLVGSPDRKFLWILSRTPTLGSDAIERLYSSAEREGFDTTKLVASPVWNAE